MTFTDNQIECAKERISILFMEKFYDFISDVKATGGIGDEFGNKYGIILKQECADNKTKNTISNILWFRSKIFSGGNIDFWIKNGFEKEIIWALVRDGFLAEYEVGYKNVFYYIKADIAKNIFKKYKRTI